MGPFWSFAGNWPFGYLASAENSPLGGMLCFAHYVLPTFYLFWIPLMIFECLLLSLAVYRGLQTLRHSGTLGRKLVIILIRDSVVYFLGWVDKVFFFSTSNSFLKQNLHNVCCVFNFRYFRTGMFSAAEGFDILFSDYLLAGDAYRCSDRVHHCIAVCS